MRHPAVDDAMDTDDRDDSLPPARRSTWLAGLLAGTFVSLLPIGMGFALGAFLFVSAAPGIVTGAGGGQILLYLLAVPAILGFVGAVPTFVVTFRRVVQRGGAGEESKVRARR